MPQEGIGESSPQECFSGRGGHAIGGGGGSDVTDEPPPMDIHLTLCVDDHSRCPYYCTPSVEVVVVTSQMSLLTWASTSPSV